MGKHKKTRKFAQVKRLINPKDTRLCARDAHQISLRLHRNAKKDETKLSGKPKGFKAENLVRNA